MEKQMVKRIWNKEPQGKQPIFEYNSILKSGFKNYYYDMKESNRDISEIDIDLVQQIVNQIIKSKYFKVNLITQKIIDDIRADKNIFETIICDYENIDNKYRFIEKIINNDLAFYNNMVNEKLINMISEPKQIEDSCEDISILMDKDYKCMFLKYFFMQLARMPQFVESYRETVGQIIKKDERFKDVNSKFVRNAIMIIFAYGMANYIDTKKTSFIERIENLTDIPFITGDSPIITKNGEGNGREVSYFCPLSPQVAMKLWITDINTSHTGNRTVCYSDEQVLEQNYLIAREAVYCVYSNSKGSLEAIRGKFQ